MKLKVNGSEVEVTSEADTPLLWVLRDELQLVGTKYERDCPVRRVPFIWTAGDSLLCDARGRRGESRDSDHRGAGG